LAYFRPERKYRIPEYYFSGKGTEIDEATDNLMLTHGGEDLPGKIFYNLQKQHLILYPNGKDILLTVR
jgi:hypothetical protein